MSRRDWGGWQLSAEGCVLDISLHDGTYHHLYEIDLERCLDSAQVLDWLVQVAGKTWATPEVVTGLLNALDDLIGLQGNLCGSGRSHRVSAKWMRETVAARARAEQFEAPSSWEESA